MNRNLNPPIKHLAMTDVLIQQQIEAIKKTAAQARKTKEGALKFLVDARIITGKESGKKNQTLIAVKKK